MRYNISLEKMGGKTLKERVTMIVNPSILNELRISAGQARQEKAENYVLQKRINIKKVIYENDKNFEIRSKVKGHGEIYDVHMQVVEGEIEALSCTCEDYYTHYGTCKHILATLLEFSRNENYIRIFSGETEEKQSTLEMYKKYQRQEEKYRNFKQLIHAFYPTHEEAQLEKKNRIIPHSIKIEPKLIYNSYLKTMKLEIKLGDKQLYKLKNFPEFYDRMQKKEYYAYGTKLAFTHEEEAFSEESLPLLHYILKYAEIIKYANESTNQYSYFGRTMEDSYITISNSGMDELFEVLQGQEVLFQKDGKEVLVLFLKGEPKVNFEIQEEGKREYRLLTNIDIYDYDIIEGKGHIYFYQDNILYQCEEEFKQNTLKLLQVFRSNLTNQIVFPKEEVSQLFSLVFPKVKEKIDIESNIEEEVKQYIPKELYVKLYLDYNEKNYITADIKFIYGDREFNPLLEEPKDIPRDIIKEDEVLEMFKQSGFMLEIEKARLILAKEDDIYQFLMQDIETYMKKFEVLATDEFKQKEIKAPKMGNIGVRIENNLLNIDFSNIDFDLSELKEIMEKYHLKKKYHRLKDGSFIELEQNETIDFLDSIAKGMDISYKELEKGELKLPIYRSLYLDRILENNKIASVSKDSNYQELIHQVEEKDFVSPIILPKNLNATLRNYQKIGYEWLKVLDSYQFGGILADDMGLRKNYSIISCYLRLCANTIRTKTNHSSMSKFINTKLEK